MTEATAGATLDVRNLREFFRDSLHDALVRQRASVDDHTAGFAQNCLQAFVGVCQSEQLLCDLRTRHLRVEEMIADNQLPAHRLVVARREEQPLHRVLVLLRLHLGPLQQPR